MDERYLLLALALTCLLVCIVATRRSKFNLECNYRVVIYVMLNYKDK